MIVVIVTSQVRPEKVAEFLHEARALRTHVLAEPGCLAYQHFVDWQSPLKSRQPGESTRITLIEHWASPEDLEAHGRRPQGKAFAEKVRPWRRGVSIEMFRAAY